MDRSRPAWVRIEFDSERASKMAQLEQAIASEGEVVEGQCGYPLYWYFDTQADGRPIVFIHSINAAPSAIELKPLFQYFRPARSVFAPDLPGFGRSTRAVGSFSAPDFAREIAAFVARISDRGEPDIVALSLGCEFVARAVLEFGMKVRSLTFISPSGFSARTPPSPKVQQRLKRLFNFAGLGRGAYKLLRTERSIRHFYGMNFLGQIPDELVRYALKTTRQGEAHQMPLQFLSMGLFTPNAVDALYRRLDVPVLVLFDEDPNVSFERFAEFEGDSRWRFRRIHPSMGMPQWECPELTTETIEEFYASL